jgi:predicted nucleotidyltransferase
LKDGYSYSGERLPLTATQLYHAWLKCAIALNFSFNTPNFRRNVMLFTRRAISHSLTLDETLARLAASPLVDGLALFGSRPFGDADPVSDYDLLVLVNQVPERIFQLFTYIHGRMTDVVVVETEMANQVLADRTQVAAASFEGMFLLKLHRAQIVYDASGRLRRGQEMVLRDGALAERLQPPAFAARYAAWFWQNHISLHLQRIAPAEDVAHRVAFDLMMAAALSDIGRAYMTVRALPWQGPKDFARHLEMHDATFLARLRECLDETNQVRKAEMYAWLAQQATAPAGEAWKPGVTALYLADPARLETHTEEALTFWEALLGYHA